MKTLLKPKLNVWKYEGDYIDTFNNTKGYFIGHTTATTFDKAFSNFTFQVNRMKALNKDSFMIGRYKVFKSNITFCKELEVKSR